MVTDEKHLSVLLLSRQLWGMRYSLMVLETLFKFLGKICTKVNCGATGDSGEIVVINSRGQDVSCSRDQVGGGSKTSSVNG